MQNAKCKRQNVQTGIPGSPGPDAVVPKSLPLWGRWQPKGLTEEAVRIRLTARCPSRWYRTSPGGDETQGVPGSSNEKTSHRPKWTR